MEYRVSIAPDRKHINVFVEGPMTTELALIVGREAVILAEENNIECYLYDLRKSRNVQTGFKNYEFGYKDVGDAGFSKASRIALLTDPNDHSHDLIETVMINNGYTIRIFHDEKSAIDWLYEK